MSWVKKVLIGDRRSTSRSSLLNVLWEGWIFLLPYTNNKVHVYHIKLLRIVSGFFNTKTIFCIVYICIYIQHVSFVHVLTIILHVRSCLKSYLFLYSYSLIVLCFRNHKNGEHYWFYLNRSNYLPDINTWDLIVLGTVNSCNI